MRGHNGNSNRLEHARTSLQHAVNRSKISALSALPCNPVCAPSSALAARTTRRAVNARDERLGRSNLAVSAAVSRRVAARAQLQVALVELQLGARGVAAAPQRVIGVEVNRARGLRHAELRALVNNRLSRTTRQIRLNHLAHELLTIAQLRFNSKPFAASLPPWSRTTDRMDSCEHSATAASISAFASPAFTSKSAEVVSS